MHIEPGFVSHAKIIAANAGAATTLGYYAWASLGKPVELLFTAAKAVIAAVFFTIFMQSFSMPVGPSELHFVGAMVMYLTLGFVPTVFGFAIGLALQGLLFEPKDLMHLGVNSLSLIVPLIAVHAAKGSKLFNKSLGQRVNWTTIVKLDAMYYAGVTAMVGFWLMLSDVATPLSAWASFAATYLAIVALEPVVTWVALKGLKSIENNAIVSRLFAVRQLTLAS